MNTKTVTTTKMRVAKVASKLLKKTTPKPAPKPIKSTEKIRSHGSIYLGSDPEFFFLKKGQAIGCERIIPVDGIEYNEGKIIIDGVQAEINPEADTCRQRLAHKTGKAFYAIDDILKKNKDVTISIDPIVPISPAELGDLSDKAKFFGCTPSFNIHDEKNVMPIKDSSKYYFRSAGGHVHIGFGSPELAHKNAEKIVKLLDIIVGNTCVLVDRHEGNIERRKLYGRAGEYRKPKHGIEYRTPSNFWLRNYILMSFVFGLTRMAVRILDSSKVKQVNWFEDEDGILKQDGVKYTHDFAQEILDAVDIADVRKAINENDFDLAMKNFKKIAKILCRIVPANMREYPIDQNNIQAFYYFVQKGQNHFFGEPTSQGIIDSWKSTADHVGRGWEEFLGQTVAPEMKAEADAKAVAPKIA